MESSGPVRDTAKAMSQENVEVVRQAYAAFDRLDMDSLLALVSDDFELDISGHPIPDFPNVGVGRDQPLTRTKLPSKLPGCRSSRFDEKRPFGALCPHTGQEAPVVEACRS